MSLTLLDPIIYGDSSADLGDHAQAADQQVDFSSDINTRTYVGDVHELLRHAGGGDDTITNFAFAAATAIGDALTITDHAQGGDDFVRAGARGEADASGDAITLSGHAHGGADTVVAQCDFSATAYGDALTMLDHAVGGNDALTGRSAHGRAVLVGDAESMSGHVLGGADTLTGAAGYPAEMYGDGQHVDGFAHGGDDRLEGGANIEPGAPFSGPNFMYGDALELLDHAHAGNDTLVSGQISADLMWGDAATVAPDSVRGQNLFVFTPPNGHDQIMDFQLGKDQIELDGFGFTGLQDLAGALKDTPDGLLISFDANDDILVRGVTASQLTAGDFIFG